MSKFTKFLGKNRPSILTFIGVGGLVGTAVMAYKAAEVVQYRLDAAYNLKLSEDPGIAAGEVDDVELTKKEKAWVYIKTLWPTFTLGAVSVAMIVLGNRDHINRRNAAIAAYYISESTLKDYQAAMIEETGEKQTEKIKEKVAEKRMNDVPVTDRTVIISESDAPWICDTATGCYFRMSYEKMRRVLAEANLELFKRDYISVADLYDMFDVEIPPGQDWFLLGWSAKDGDIEYFTTSALREIHGERVPCMVLEYRVKPHYDFDVYG